MTEQTDSHFPNLPPFINQWKIKEIQNQLGISPDQPIKRTDRGKMGSDYRLTSLNGEQWQIMIKPKIEYCSFFNMSELELSRLTTTLTTKQKPEEPTNREEKQHRKAVFFLSANWRRLAKIFYPLEIEETTKPHVFIEVVLNQKGSRADLIGIGPDGTIIIVEFSARTKGKQAQIDKYKQELKELIKKLNPKTEPRIIAFKANYSQSSERTTLIITPSDE